MVPQRTGCDQEGIQTNEFARSDLLYGQVLCKQGHGLRWKGFGIA